MKKLSIFLLVFVFTQHSFSQSGEILMTVGNEKVYADEFLHMYKKNNSDNINEESLDNYIELYKNFKLKVVEAQNLKMDTSKAFINEFQGYRDQLAKPFLSENIKYQDFVKEAYNRNKFEIKLDIIFIKLSKNASAEDTLLTYEKVIKIRNRLLNGENFEKVATETSDDNRVAQNKGHLPFLPTLKIPYNIQSYAFKARKGALSMPIRSINGYYIVKLIDKRPAKDIYKVSHIMISNNSQMTEAQSKLKKKRIDSIYNRILSGDKFEDLVKYSDDKGTAKKGGELPEFSTNVMVPEFEEVVFKMTKQGEISKPFKTKVGWHIIKLIEIKKPKSFEDQKDNIKRIVVKDPERKEIVKKYVINKLKSEYKYKNLSKPELFYSIVDSTIFMGNWKFNPTNNSSTLFTINANKYTENSFGNYLENKQKRSSFDNVILYVDKMYTDFIYECLSDAEKLNLKRKFPKYKYLLKEYHDGMLIFELMKIEVWDKASNDSIGAKKYFNENKLNYNNRITINTSVFKYENIKYYNEAVRLLNKSRNKYTDNQIVEKIAGSSPKKLKLLEAGNFSKSESVYADKIFSMINDNKLIENQKVVNLPAEKTFIFINSKNNSSGQSFNNVKGTVIADYQLYLEKKWLNDLKRKYKIIVDEKVLRTIKSSLN